MRAVIQRVLEAGVTVKEEQISRIGPGLLVLLGVGKEDTEADMEYIASKILHLRIFEDEEGKMNRSLLEEKKELLLVSQFTLYGDVRKGRRPGFDQAGDPERAKALYEKMVEFCQKLGVKVKTGIFQAHMKVDLINDGPVTILMDSKKQF